jgi:hypothetical protein
MKTRAAWTFWSGGRHIAAMSVAVVTIGVGAIVGTYLMLGQGRGDMLWPEPGAEYELPDLVGQPLPPDKDTPEIASQTLRIGLRDGVRLSRLDLKNMSLGKAGLGTSFQITRDVTTGVTGANAYLFVGELIITNSSAPGLSWESMEVGDLTLAARVDGHTQEVQIDSTIPEVIISSQRGSGVFSSTDAIVDRVIIQVNGTSGASVGVMTVDGLKSSIGTWDWQWLKVGKLTLAASNEFGDGSGINNASAIWASSIAARNVTDQIVDTPISVR